MKILRQILFTILLCSFAHMQSVVTKSHNMIEAMDVIIDSQPNVALKMGFKILEDYSSESPDSTIAKTHLLIASVLNKQGLPAQSMEYYIKGLDYYISSGRILETGWFYNDLGNIYFSQRMFEQAKEKYKTAREIFIETEVLYAEATTVNNLALIEKEQGNYGEALILFNEALGLRTKYGKEPYVLAHSYKYLGDLSLEIGDTKSAMNYYEKIIDIGVTEGKGNIEGLSLQSIGEIYFKKNDIHKAEEYFQLAEKSFISEYHPKYLVQLYIRLAEIYSNNEQIDLSELYLQKALPVAEQHGLIDYNIFILHRLIELTERTEDLSQTLRYYHHLDSLRHKQYEAELQQSFNRAETQLELSDNKQKLAEKEIRLKTAQSHMALSAIIGFLLILLLWMLSRRYIQNLRLAKGREEIVSQKLNIETLKADQRQKEIEIKKNELLNKATLIQQKNSLLNSFLKELQNKVKLLTVKDRKQFIPLISYLEGIQNTDDQWNDFEKQFTSTYPNLLKTISLQFPELTAADLKICAFLKMKMTTKEISSLTGLTVRAVEVRRSRLRKKMNIPKGENLNTFFMTFETDN